MVSVELNVVLAAPDYFYRLAGFLGEDGRFHGKIRKGFSAERATEQRDVHGYIFLLRSHGCGNRVACAYGALCGRPGFYLSVAIDCQRGRRLHRSMCKKRRVV